MDWLFKKRTLSFVTMLFFVMTGTYNAIIINSESQINGADVRFVKRLDELKGIIEPGRLVATGIQWQKMAPTQAMTVNALHVPNVQQSVNTIVSSNGSGVEPQSTPAAAVTEELNLNLVEVINPKKYQNGITASQFSGSLTTSNGTIDSLSVSLPNSEGLTVSFSEMNGNVFEYDLEGEIYSGMLYQVDQSSYMVTLTNGPLEGTRLRFVGEPSQEQVAANDHANVGNTGADEFGNPGDKPDEPQQTVQAEEVQQQPEVAPAPEQMVNMEQAPVEQATADPDAQFQQQGQMDFQQNT